MPFRNVVDADAVAMLVRVLDTYCVRHGVTDEENRQSLAASILWHYQRGMEDEQLLAEFLEHWKPPGSS